MKFIIVGDISVGKSSLLRRFESDDFVFTSAPTMGIEFVRKKVKINDAEIMIQVWDTSGEERMFSLTSQYYKSACAVLLVFDVSRQETFSHLKTWIQRVDDNANAQCKRLLIGNKTDLEFQRQVSRQEAESFAKQYGISYVETSAKTARNVFEAFNQIALEIYSNA